MSSCLLLCVRQIGYLPLKNHQNLSAFQNYCIKIFGNFWILGSLETGTMRQGRCFRICHCFYNVKDNGPSEKAIKKLQHSTKKKLAPKVLVIDQEGKEYSMYYYEAEKIAKANHLRLVKLENVGLKREVYKLEKETDIILLHTNAKKECKKFIIRDVIEDHDLENKINGIWKFLEKNITIICIVDNMSVNNRLNEISAKLKNSKLKDYLVQENITSKKIILTFQKNSSIKEENSETQNVKKKESE